MKQRVLWEGIELWPYEEGDEEGPHGTLLVEYVMDAVIEKDMRVQLYQMIPDQGLAVAAKSLHKMLDYRTTLQDCLSWLKMFIESVKKDPNNKRNDVKNPETLAPILLSGKFWARLQDIKDKPGWKILDRRRKRNRILKHHEKQPEKELDYADSNQLDNLGE